MNRIREDTGFGEKLFVSIIYGTIAMFALLCVLPFWLVLVNSFAAEHEIAAKGYQLLPSTLTTYAYEYMFTGRQVFRSYANTIFITVVGTTIALLVSSMFAYSLSHPKVAYLRAVSFMTYFTMLFGAGLVGYYVLIASWLGLKDSIWALILPNVLNPFYVFILISFFRTVPYEIIEAATVDGAGDIHAFFRIIMPISAPALATVGLFYALHYWNEWFNALLFIDNHKLHPLQIMIRQLLSNINAESYIGSNNATLGDQQVPAYGVQLATVCITIGPIILLYPLLQRYYVKGLTIGALKG